MRSLIKRSEIAPIDELRREMDHFFDEMVPFSRFSERRGDGFEVWAPNTDMTETDDMYLIEVDLPGISKDEVHLNYKDNRLTISGERKKEERKETDNMLRSERYHGSFIRTFTFPNPVDDDMIKATFRDGVLQVTVQKSEESEPRHIDIS